MVLGRIAERARIDDLLASACAGRRGALLITGEAGIGKTALLDHAAAAAADLRVLRGVGIESVAELPFAGLHLLLHPYLDRLGALPGPQAAALRTAFGLDEGTVCDRFLIGAATLSLLSELSGDGPLVCLIDDTQWFDRASLDALLFATRRLHADPIAMIFVAGGGDGDAPPRQADPFIRPAPLAGDPASVAFAAPVPGLDVLRLVALDVLRLVALDVLRLVALDQESATSLLDAHARGLAAPLRERVLAESRGNPLAVIELATALSSLPGDGRPAPPPGAGHVQDAFQARIAGLPAATRLLLLIAAADDTGSLQVILRVGTLLGVAAADLEPAERARLVVLSPGGRVTFRHPLIRAAAYQVAPHAGRVQVHEAFARALDGAYDADRRAWHLAAAPGPDEAVAAELERAARRAGRRGGVTAMMSAFERAAQLSTDETRRAWRLIAAARAAYDAGLPDHAAELADQAAELPDRTAGPVDRALGLTGRGAGSTDRAPGLTDRNTEPADQTLGLTDRNDEPAGRVLGLPAHNAGSTDQALGPTDRSAESAGRASQAANRPVRPFRDPSVTAEAAWIRAQVEYERSSPAVAAALALDAAALIAATDPERAVSILTEAVWYARDAGDHDLVRQCAALLETVEPGAPVVAGLIGFWHLYDGRPAVGVPAMRELAGSAGRGKTGGFVERLIVGFAGMLVAEDEIATEVLESLVADVREQGAVGRLTYALEPLAIVQLLRGRFMDADAGVTEAISLATDLGQDLQVVALNAIAAWLAAVGGDEIACRSLAAGVLEHRTRHPTDAALASWALGLLHLAGGRFDEAAARLDEVCGGPARHDFLIRAVPDHVEAAVRAGLPEQAARHLPALSDWAEHTGRPYAIALARRCAALPADEDTAAEHFTAALELHGRDPRRYDEARTRLAYGEWLHRHHRRTEAKGQLADALAAFERLGARMWASRARAELSALGDRPSAHPRALDPLARLTPQELQVVRLAAAGMSNREIAARLFLSPRTVGHHLHKAYPKLGVTRRSELAQLVPHG
ncbi:AAA family ATPase [Nonomuraea angiospora]|uniref:DNA-binding CsgD family transcriptional regulator n=1 Tax=Nonomuraea angiospora TaxID=46172 RepID=A0ABR9LVC1_9ACTN|nr:helix-turn-helix transcriptional regulator [Nonomuraea angiospora]MBE1584601.1 DNA-binding CsgD family transcriptional regulator [Nonomuraea angiospora]